MVICYSAIPKNLRIAMEKIVYAGRSAYGGRRLNDVRATENLGVILLFLKIWE
jgi:hypothetical protein